MAVPDDSRKQGGMAILAVWSGVEKQGGIFLAAGV